MERREDEWVEEGWEEHMEGRREQGGEGYRWKGVRSEIKIN